MRLHRIILPLLVATLASSCTGCRERDTKPPPPAAVPSVQVITDPAEIAAARKAWSDSREQLLASLLADPAGFFQEDEWVELLRSQRDRSVASLSRTRDDAKQPAKQRVGAILALAAIGTAPDPAQLASIATDDQSVWHLLSHLGELYKPRDNLPAPLRPVVVRAIGSSNEPAARQAAHLARVYRISEAADVVLERVRTDPKADSTLFRSAAALTPTAEVLDAILKRAGPAGRPSSGEMMEAVADFAKASTDAALRRRAADACLQYLKQKPDGPSVDGGTFDSLDTLAKAAPADQAKAALADVVRTARHKYVREYALERLNKLDTEAATKVSGETKVSLPEEAAASRAASVTRQKAADVCVRHKVLTRAEADAALAALAARDQASARADGYGDEAGAGDEPVDEVPALLHAARRFAAFDVETGMLPNRHDRLILELAEASAGQFKPEAAVERYVADKPPREAAKGVIVEDGEEESGTYTVQFIHAGRLYRFNPRNLGDWYDLSAVLVAVNRAVADAGASAQFVPLASDGQIAELVFSDPAALRAAAPELGLKPGTDADDARRQGKAYEESAIKRLTDPEQ
jgi:hypothetical protein